MTPSEQKIKMIGQMAQDAGLIEDPQWLERLNEPVPLWVVLDLLLRWIDQTESGNGRPFD
ncbi:hypothetical protein [Cohnella sp. WQ 127256]|uniref:hypothetical protein n=1 Tax=Cohnella sp. WQ 127256 TaxID=2938790 RepID=UPI0021191FF9|nr:hypothetical protein [Cohnella sp. WQ 127256]